MTITYQSKVTSASSCAFGKLLGKWKGSIYKLVYKELVFYGFCYAVISLTYRHLLKPEERRMFEKICLWVEDTVDMIPLTFVLGFYVSFVVQRWWDQFLNIPWPDRVTAAIALYVDGKDEGGRLVRRTMVRYLNLSFILVAQSVSVAVRKRFPTILHLEDAGLLTHEETETLRNLTSESNKYWVPISWLIAVLRTAKRDGRIKDPLGSKSILEEVNSFRKNTSTLWCYDWVSVPLVYTQVVTWATHLFFIACLLGRQILDPAQDYGQLAHGARRPRVDVYVPVFTLLQFLFYMGWLKVAEQLINPFGEDDDDLEINYLIDRHLQVSYLAVDELFDTHPELVKDQFWSEENPVRLPYSASTLRYRKKSYLGSAWDIRLNEESSLPAQHLMRIPEESNSEYEMHALLKNAHSMPYLGVERGKGMMMNNQDAAELPGKSYKKTSTTSMVATGTPSQQADDGRGPVSNTYQHPSHHHGFVHGRWSVAASHLLTMWRKISMSRSSSEAATCSSGLDSVVACNGSTSSAMPHSPHRRGDYALTSGGPDERSPSLEDPLRTPTTLAHNGNNSSSCNNNNNKGRSCAGSIRSGWWSPNSSTAATDSPSNRRRHPAFHCSLMGASSQGSSNCQGVNHAGAVPEVPEITIGDDCDEESRGSSAETCGEASAASPDGNDQNPSPSGYDTPERAAHPDPGVSEITSSSSQPSSRLLAGSTGIRRKYSMQHGSSSHSRDSHRQHGKRNRPQNGPEEGGTMGRPQPPSLLPGLRPYSSAGGKKVSFPALPAVSPIPERASFDPNCSFEHIDDDCTSCEGSDEGEHQQ